MKTIFKTAHARHVIPENPARDTLPLAVVKRHQGKKAHLPFSTDEVSKIFSSPIFQRLELPRGRSGNSACWIPPILGYTGARAEEITGLSASEVVQDPEHGWFLRVTDVPDDETADLYDEDGKRTKRGLKTVVSRRRVPVAQELIDLGLLRYVRRLKDRGEVQLFPELSLGGSRRAAAIMPQGRHLTTIRTMIRFVLLAVALSFFAGCATNEQQNEPQYQIGATGSRQTKSEAERAHAGGSPQTRLTADYDSAPRVLSSQFPEYPRDLQNAGIEGQVVVRFTVEPDGSVSDPVVQGSPPPQLAAVTLDAVRQWKFAPAMKDGVRIRARLEQPFLFKTE